MREREGEGEREREGVGKGGREGRREEEVEKNCGPRSFKSRPFLVLLSDNYPLLLLSRNDPDPDRYAHIHMPAVFSMQLSS